MQDPGDTKSCKMWKSFDSKWDGKKFMSFEQGSDIACECVFV